jgi:hypothetical protein
VFGGELVVQRLGVVVVDQDEAVPGGECAIGGEDELVAAGRNFRRTSSSGLVAVIVFSWIDRGRVRIRVGGTGASSVLGRRAR